MWKLPRLLGLCWELRQPWPARPLPRNSLTQNPASCWPFIWEQEQLQVGRDWSSTFLYLMFSNNSQLHVAALGIKKKSSVRKFFFCVALISGSPAASNIRCYWQDPALSPSIFHRRSRQKWLRRVLYIGLSNELGNFLINERIAAGTHIYQDNEAVQWRSAWGRGGQLGLSFAY